jgi:alpha,alpha-trehalose phosphorylase
MRFRGRTLLVDVHRDESGRQATSQATTYRLLVGDPTETSHHGTPVHLEVGHEVTLPVPPPPSVEAVSQPFGRAPQGYG